MTANTPLDAIVTDTAPGVDAAVIWLHGLGADGHDFAPIVEQLQLPASAAIRFIFPHAPMRPVTLNQGYVMPAWFDLHGLSLDSREDEAGLFAARDQIEALIARECDNGIDSRRIVLAGFSQGGALALLTGLTHAEPLAGIMALSTWLPLRETIFTQMPPHARQTPLLMAHGAQDDVLPIAFGRQSATRLEQAGVAVEWHEYPMAHAVCAQEIADIRHWLLRVLNTAA